MFVRSMMTMLGKANDDDMIAAWMNGLDAAFQLGETARQERRACLAFRICYPLELGNILGGETIRQLALPGCQNVDGKMAAIDKSVIAVGGERQAEQYQRRIEGQATERSSRKPPRLPFCITSGNDGHGTREMGLN